MDYGKSSTTINSIGNDIVGFYSYNKVIDGADKSFEEQLKYYDNELIQQIKSVYNKVLPLISEFELKKLYITITNTNSIFFRFSTSNNDYEFKFEVFFDYDCYDEDDIESILHIYENGTKKSAHFGSIHSLYVIINKLSISYFVYGMDKLDKKEMESVYYPFQIEYNKSVPFALNTYPKRHNNFHQQFKQVSLFR